MISDVTFSPYKPMPTNHFCSLSPDALNGWCPITDWGVIRVAGEDAASFLHGQLTQDFALLGQGQARLAAYCSPKGRMLASFVGFKKSSDEIWLLVAKDLLAGVMKRLSMFVLRAKVKLTDISPEVHLVGAVGSLVPIEVAGSAVWDCCSVGGVEWVRLPDACGLVRAVACLPLDGPLPDSPALSAPVWQWLEVRSAVAMVTQPIVDAFVPQMLNYESVGGVNFKKGCYPGQEVVARSQFRGTLKRRGFLVHGHDPMQVGQEVYNADDLEQPCGTVASVAPHPDGGWDAVVSMQISATQSGSLVLSGGSKPLELLPLPYELLEDI